MSDLKQFNALIVKNTNTQEYLQQVLGDRKQEFVNNLTALVANNESLQKCEPLSIMYAAIKSTALDLPLDQNLGFAYVIPFNNTKKGVQEAQFQIGYKGYVQLAMRSGQFRTINVRDVREGELIDEDFVSGELKFRRLPDKEREEAEVVGYVAYFRLVNGFEKMTYWTKAEVLHHAERYSETFKSKKDWVRTSSKWATDFDAMAKKTVLKLLLSKYAPMSVQIRDAVKYDQAVIEKDEVHYVDNDAQGVEVGDAATKETAGIFRQTIEAEEAEVCEPEAKE